MTRRVVSKHEVAEGSSLSFFLAYSLSRLYRKTSHVHRTCVNSGMSLYSVVGNHDNEYPRSYGCYTRSMRRRASYRVCSFLPRRGVLRTYGVGRRRNISHFSVIATKGTLAKGRFSRTVRTCRAVCGRYGVSLYTSVKFLSSRRLRHLRRTKMADCRRGVRASQEGFPGVYAARACSVGVRALGGMGTRKVYTYSNNVVKVKRA